MIFIDTCISVAFVQDFLVSAEDVPMNQYSPNFVYSIVDVL